MDHKWKNVTPWKTDFTKESLLQVEDGTLFNLNPNYKTFECVKTKTGQNSKKFAEFLRKKLKICLNFLLLVHKNH